jgi:phosphoglycerate dehydrogenase-like enzyme
MDNFYNKVRIISDDSDRYIDLIQKAQLADLMITESNADANIVLGAPPMVATMLDSFPLLEWMQSTYAGIDTLVQPDLRTDYDLTNVRGIFGQQIAEYVLGYTIQYTRHFERYRAQQRAQNWQPHPYQTLAEKKMVILGTGTIGNHLAGCAASLGLQTIGVNRTGIPPKASAFHQICHIEQLTNYLSDAAIIVSTLPKTVQTTGLFNQQFFAHCHQALFFNVGRGDAVDTPSLLSALEQGQIQHAFLDVFINEPISQQCPYWQHPHVTVTPHIAAYSFPEQVFAIFAENYRLWRDGFQLKNQIDFDKGY